jgi:16S rRNA (cytosine967-C5)-methyltransferase
MSFTARYLERSAQILQSYDGSMPLVHYLKNYFAQNKKHGSKDRKHISHLCYCYYRLGHANIDLSIQEKIKVGLFICQEEAGTWADLYDDHWLQHWDKVLANRIAFIQQQCIAFKADTIFPWKDVLSAGIAMEAFSLSHLIQPDLFIRIRPKQTQVVLQKLHDEAIHFKQLTSTCIALPNSTKVDELLAINKQVVVQDYSSQRIATFLEAVKSNAKHQTANIKVWDCCAASGGKSILAKDVLGNVQLTVSDVRASMIANLKERLFTAGINLQQTLVMNLEANMIPTYLHKQFDLIIADVPCTGSGTWSRTPEQLSFFKPNDIQTFASTQKKIASNIIPAIKPHGYLLYITCSVFKEENEAVVEYLQQTHQLEIINMEVLKGYHEKADSMFGALLKKPA